MDVARKKRGELRVNGWKEYVMQFQRKDVKRKE
jgi:hypothetical protein